VDGLKHNFAREKSWGTLIVTQKCTRSGSLFLSDGQYVGSHVDRCCKLFLSIVLSTLRPLGVVSVELQLAYLAL
jgi:hypothetical protein